MRVDACGIHHHVLLPRFAAAAAMLLLIELILMERRGVCTLCRCSMAVHLAAGAA